MLFWTLFPLSRRFLQQLQQMEEMQRQIFSANGFFFVPPQPATPMQGQQQEVAQVVEEPAEMPQEQMLQRLGCNRFMTAMQEYARQQASWASKGALHPTRILWLHKPSVPLRV